MSEPVKVRCTTMLGHSVDVPLMGLVEYTLVALKQAVDEKGLRVRLDFDPPPGASYFYIGEDRVRAALEEMIQKLVREMR